MKFKNDCVYFCRFLPSANPDGGVRRLFQIQELIKDISEIEERGRSPRDHKMDCLRTCAVVRKSVRVSSSQTQSPGGGSTSFSSHLSSSGRMRSRSAATEQP